MLDPPDSLDDDAIVEAFLLAYAAGTQMTEWYIRLDRIQELCGLYRPDPPAAPSHGD